MKQKGNQKGFTLLELLIAVAILAIIVVPILNAFLTSVTVNAKAKDKQRASVAASNVIEDIKSWDIKKVISDMTLSEDGSYEKVEMVDGRAFTVKTTIDKTPQTEDESGDESTDYNEQELCNLYSVNKTYDGIYVQSREQDMNIAKDLKGIGGEGVDILQGVRRDMVITISKVGNSYSSFVQNTYSYGSGSNKKVKATEKQEVFANKENAPRNIYVFYQPMYNGSLRNVNEYFTVDNQEGLPVNVYLICQNVDGWKSSNYLTQLRCLEKKRSNWETEAMTRIRSNLPEGKEGAKGLWLTYMTEDTLEEITDAQWMQASEYGNVKAAKILDFKDVTNKTKDAWVYKVTVQAFKGQGDKRENESLVTYKTTITKE